MERSNLPFDILINTIHELDNDVCIDHHTLQACALVCRALVSSCQKSIFYKLTLENFHRTDPSLTTRSNLNLLDILSNDSNIGSYVRELRLFELECPGGLSPPGSNTVNTTSREVTALILSRFTCLQKLAIFGYMWLMFSEVKESLYDIARLPTLTHLHIECAQSIPDSFFLALTDLRHLSLTTSGYSDFGSIVPGERGFTDMVHGVGLEGNRPRLDSLKIWDTVHNLSFHLFSSLLTTPEGQSSFDITHLRGLYTAYIPHRTFEEVSMSCGASLGSLMIRYTDSAYSRSQPVNFVHLTSLISLTLVCDQSRVSWEIIRPSWEVIRLMETLPSPDLLEELTMVFRADVKYRGELVGQEFLALDLFLSRHANHLQTFTLYCISDKDEDECKRDFQTYLHAKIEIQMPKLSRMGVIRVSTCNSDYFGYRAFCY